MTWIYGWPLYDQDAVEIARRNGLVKDPSAGRSRLVEAAQLWVQSKARFPRMLCCWVGDTTELVYAAYVDYRDREHPPRKVIREGLMSKKEAYRLARYMPLKDGGWYRHCDGSWCPWLGERWPKDEDGDDSDDEESGESSDEGSDEEDDQGSDCGESNSSSEDGSNEDTDSDNVTVIDGYCQRFQASAEEHTDLVADMLLAKDFDEYCSMVAAPP
ncbi:hypothetical protein DAEQUDRAFT_815006 [Daedalea quercina L-15889]|uniref:Uncharacterized protein n=1 Tax=Daedalea quercina L-15889 TaxID=1314783 RepID=A0A165LGD1_9APHY|nr:hypothetical protein DAEQUDRAFT_815006 [Daedalea quercina L-15889]